MTDAPMSIIVRWDADGDSQAVHGLDADPVSIEARYRRSDLPVRVKPLVWKNSAMVAQGGWLVIRYADCTLGRYDVEQNDRAEVTRLTLNRREVETVLPKDILSAIAAAQADHDARIRAALEE